MRVALDHPDPVLGSVLLTQALGSTSFDFSDGLLSQLANAGSTGPAADKRGINFMLAVVTGLEPRDEVEAMLAAQMAAVHMATLTFARRLAHVENIPQQDSAERAFNKLARTFAAQVEALKRYRTGGEQKVTVQHVTVNGLNVGRNPAEALRVLDALQTDELCPCNWTPGEEVLKPQAA